MVKYTEVENQESIKNSLTNDIIELEFLKADGTLRKMKATFKSSTQVGLVIMKKEL